MNIMLETMLKLIERFDTIVIHRHQHPDYDALGSQLGLKALIEENYPTKHVYAVGDENRLTALGRMDVIEDAVYQEALAIVVDVAGKDRVSDTRFISAKERIIIDHHLNDTDIEGLFIQDTTAIAVAQMITHMAQEVGWRFNPKAAQALMMGIITDSGRFLYPGVNEKTFEATAVLMPHVGTLSSLYDAIYREPLNIKQLKGDALKRIVITAGGVAVLRNGPTLKTTYGVDDFTVSRGLVSTMSYCEGAEAWVNFTEIESGDIWVEIRSAKVPVVEVAKAFGGGGHALACGCTLKDWSQSDTLIRALEEALDKGETHETKT